MFARLGAFGRQASRREGLIDLVVEIGSVGHQHDTRRGNTHRERLREHHHGQRLARSLRMPDNAACASSAVVARLDTLQQVLHREILLMARHLLHTAVEEREAACEIEDALWAAETYQHFVERCDEAVPRLTQTVMLAAVEAEVLEDRVLICCVDRAVDDLGDVIGRVFALSPGRPELCRRADRRVAGLMRICGDQHLRREEQVWRAEIWLLVAQVLADPLRNLLLAALHLDDGERDAVHEQNDVRTDARPLRPVDRELARHVKGVRPHTVWVEAPIDVAERPFARLAIHCLRQRDAKVDQVGLALVGAHQPIEADILETFDGRLDVPLREGMRAAAGADAVKRCKLSAQRVLKQDASATVPPLSIDLRARDIAPAERRQRHERLKLLATSFGKGEFWAFGHSMTSASSPAPFADRLAFPFAPDFGFSIQAKAHL